MGLIVRFNYSYRDSDDNKKFGSKLFSNPFQQSLAKIHQGLKEKLIFEKYFYPYQVNIKKFKFHRFNKRDYSWYEYESVEYLEDKNIDIEKRIENLDASIHGFFLDLSHMFY